MKGPLDAIRLLDTSQMLAGPLCGMRLGDLGAEVLKIEPPGLGEWTRTHGFAGAEIQGETTALLGINRNKKSVTLNLKTPEGQSTLYALARKSDVFIQNFRVGIAARLGVGYEQLRAVNPAIIYCSISGYGETGPYANRPGQDLVLQGYSGSMWSVGKRSDPPLPGALWAIDAMTAYQAAVGVLAALHHRTRTGEGQRVNVNMLGVVMDAQCQELTTHLNLGILPERPEVPSAHAWINAPYGAYPTANGWIVLAMAPISSLGAAIDDEVLRAMTSWSDGAVGDIEFVQCHMASPTKAFFSGSGGVPRETAPTLVSPDPRTWQVSDNGGGYPHGQLTHSTALMFWLTGLRAVEVRALTTSPGSAVDMYDAATIILDNGAIAAVSGAATLPENDKFQLDVRIFGSQGCLLVDVERERVELRRHDGRHRSVAVGPGEGAYSCEIPPGRFIELIRGISTENNSPAHVGARSVELLEALKQSAAAGGSAVRIVTEGEAIR